VPPFVVLMFVGFLGSIMTSTARAYLLHQQQHKMRTLQQQHKQRQSAARERRQAQGGGQGLAGAPGRPQRVLLPRGGRGGQGEGQVPGGGGVVYQDAADAWMGPEAEMRPPGAARAAEDEAGDEVLGHETPLGTL